MKTKKSKIVKKVKITKVKPKPKINKSKVKSKIKVKNKVKNKPKKIIRAASKSKPKKKFSFVKPEGINFEGVKNQENQKVVKEKTYVLRPAQSAVKQENKVYSPEKQFKQRLEFLSPGETFEIPTLKNIKRNGVFLFSTPAASLIKIDNYDPHKEIWNNNCREYCANSVEVIVTGKVNLITANNGIVDVEGSTEIDELGEVIKHKRGRKKLHAAAPKIVELDDNGNKIIKKRGRKRVEREFSWPKGKFTIEDAANLNNCEKYTITNEINRLLKNKQPVPVVVGNKPNSGGRGKPINILQFKK